LPDYLRRGLRTFIQAQPLIPAILGLLVAFGAHLTKQQIAAVEAVAAAFAAWVVAWNAIEDATGKGLLKHDAPVPAARRRRDPIGHEERG
jgi:hypothetical protein